LPKQLQERRTLGLRAGAVRAGDPIGYAEDRAAEREFARERRRGLPTSSWQP
jgi:hypothetical protein